jgi:Protein of unknown function (DUF3306)
MRSLVLQHEQIMEVAMRDHVISTFVLAATLAFAASESTRACENVNGPGPCPPVVAESQPAVPLGRIASLGELNRSPIETLTAQSDYTMFLKPNVPAEMQRRALRKLWLSDPIFAYRDGLNNWDEDYTRPGDPGFYDEQRGLDNFAQAPAQ